MGLRFLEVALNLLPAKWTYVLDGLEKYRAKIGGHDASSVYHMSDFRFQP